LSDYRAVFLEFNIPRMGRQIHAVLLISPAVFVIESKMGGNVLGQRGPTSSEIFPSTSKALILRR
jgi:hypothetical protein